MILILKQMEKNEAKNIGTRNFIGYSLYKTSFISWNTLSGQHILLDMVFKAQIKNLNLLGTVPSDHMKSTWHLEIWLVTLWN